MSRYIDADILKAYLQKNSVNHTLADIDAQPTVDAEPVKHGKWTHTKWSNMRHDYTCSLCGCRIEGADPFSLSATTYNYCPECGAKMDEVTDEAD